MRALRTFAPIALLLCFALSAFADDDTAQTFMKARQTELSALVKKHETQQKIGAVFDAILDYGTLAQGSLKDHWAERTDAERKDFSDVLKQLVQRAYRRNLDRTADYDVRFDGEDKQADGFIVKTVAQSRTNAREEPISIDYLVHRVDGAWRIEDIITEGSSLVNNYHQQFNRIIKKDGFPELMKRMRKKLASNED
jgi:phospholipid transport system substrate-binding protein